MKHSGKWDERHWLRIEDEYQEPAREVVRVFHHEMKIPICRIAEILFVTEYALRKWCKMWKLKTLSKGYIKKDTPGKVQIRAHFLGYRNVPEAIAVMRADGLRWEDICLKLKCGSGTISRYMSESAKGYHHITEAGREIKRQTAKRLNERMEAGEIERGGFAKVPLDFVTRAKPYDTGSRL